MSRLNPGDKHKEVSHLALLRDPPKLKRSSVWEREGERDAGYIFISFSQRDRRSFGWKKSEGVRRTVRAERYEVRESQTDGV